MPPQIRNTQVAALLVQNDFPLPDCKDPIGVGERLLHVVRGEQERDPLLPGELAEKVHHFLAGNRIKAGNGFVRDDHSGLLHQGSGDRNPLGLTARELVRPFQCMVREPYPFEARHCPVTQGRFGQELRPAAHATGAAQVAMDYVGQR